MAWPSGRAYGQDSRYRVLVVEGAIHKISPCFVVSDSYVARVDACEIACEGSRLPNSK